LPVAFVTICYCWMLPRSIRVGPIHPGMVYIGSNDHRVYALDVRTGAKRWSITTGDMLFPPPAVANGTVFVGSYDHRMYALDAQTGTQQWSFTTRGSHRYIARGC
jgi:eukaryotic-like serine/threonine-protein kinase